MVILGLLTDITDTIPALFLVGLGVLLVLMAPGKAQRKHATGVKGDVEHKSFDDIAGCDETIEDLDDTVRYLKDPKQYAELGALAPKDYLLHQKYLRIVYHEVDLLAHHPAQGSAQYVALSYAQFAGLNELYKALRGGADMLNAGLECNARDCREFGDAVLRHMDELLVVCRHPGDFELFFVSPSLMGSCVTALEKIWGRGEGMLWSFMPIKDSGDMRAWLTDMAHFFQYSQGVFKA